MSQQQIKGIAEELKFWKRFVTTERFLKGWVADTPTPELHHIAREFIQRHQGKVLDVGSGVVSILHGTAKDLTAMDLLGEQYELIFDYQAHGIKPPIPTAAEHIKAVGEYDIVHMSNALDHCQAPEIAFDKLLRAVKKDGHLIIQGFENEAEFEDYQGMHQHNLSLEKDWILHRDRISQTLFKRANVKIACAQRIFFENKTWFIWICQKKY